MSEGYDDYLSIFMHIVYVYDASICIRVYTCE